jgi:hypothetical protein
MTLAKDADVAWGFSKHPTAQTELAQRKLVFDAGFWPSLHFDTQTRMASSAGAAAGGPWPPPEFFPLLVEALCILESQDATAMKLDFRRFPAAPERGIRKLRVGQVGDLYWRFATRSDAADDDEVSIDDIFVCKFVNLL